MVDDLFQGDIRYKAKICRAWGRLCGMRLYYIILLVEVYLLVAKLQSMPVIGKADLFHAENSGVKKYCSMNVFYCKNQMIQFGDIHWQ